MAQVGLLNEAAAAASSAGASGTVVPEAPDPPEVLRSRQVWVQLNQLNTVVIPHDPVYAGVLVPDAGGASEAQWFAKDELPPGQPVPAVRAGNEVLYFIDGKETFEQFRYEIERTSGDKDFIYLAGWILFLDLDLGGPASAGSDPQAAELPAPRASGSTVRQLLAAAARRGVEIRVMLPESAGGVGEAVANTFDLGVNAFAVKWIREKLGNRGAAILDGRTLVEGTHHQKLLVVRRGSLLTAFCGGVDINPDRVEKSDHGAPLHDVHCRVRGPAAYDLLRVFVQRWQDYATHSSDFVEGRYQHRQGTPTPAALLGAETRVPPVHGNLTVQVGRTYGNGSVFSYDFAPKGERSILSLVTSAITASRRFIYLEDQYLVSMTLATLLAGQLPKIKHLTILVPAGSLCDLAQGPYRRKLFIDKLKAAGQDKVRVYFLKDPGPTCARYVHAKTWIFDDEFAIVGSANSNRRGMTHDSEVSAGTFDPSDDSALTYRFAHRLRIKLWAHHLGMDDPKGHAELADGVAAGDMWLHPFRPATARVDDYDVNECSPYVHKTDSDWDHNWDPDGS